MNGNRYALRLTKIFSLYFAALFMLLGFSIIVSGYEHEKNVNTYNCSALKHYIIIFSAAAVTALLIITYHCVQNAGRRLGGDKHLRDRPLVHESHDGVVRVLRRAADSADEESDAVVDRLHLAREVRAAENEDGSRLRFFCLAYSGCGTSLRARCPTRPRSC